MNKRLRTGFKIKETIGIPIVNAPFMPLHISPPPGGNNYNYNEANCLLSGIGIVFGNSRLSERSRIRSLSLMAIIISDVVAQNSHYRISFPQHISPMYFSYTYDQRGHMYIYRGRFRLSKTPNYSNLEQNEREQKRSSSIQSRTRNDHQNELFDFVKKEALRKLKIKSGLHIDFSASEENMEYYRNKGL